MGGRTISGTGGPRPRGKAGDLFLADYELALAVLAGFHRGASLPLTTYGEMADSIAFSSSRWCASTQRSLAIRNSS